MSERLSRLVNLGLRLVALAAKLLLMLYMARFVSPADFGEYGLVAGTVSILMTAAGIRLDYVTARELVRETEYECARKMRDQLWFYGLNYGVLGTALALIALSGIPLATYHTLLFIYVLTILESCSALMFTNMVSLGRPIVSTMLLLIRTGLWVLPLAAAGIVNPVFRTADAIFVAWILGAIASIVFAAWAWRALPWRSLQGVPVDWEWIWRSVRGCTLIWVSTLAATAGTLVDRFVVAADLNLDLVGVLTFYASFATALYSLIESSVFYTYPRLIDLYQDNNKASFNQEAIRLSRTAALHGAIIAVPIAIIVPMVGIVLHRPLLLAEAPTLWLLLFATWIRINAKTLYLVLFATHRDRAIWLGDLLYLIPALGGNMILVPLYGFPGIGYSAIIASTFLLIWRGWHIRAEAATETRMDKIAEPT